MIGTTLEKSGNAHTPLTMMASIISLESFMVFLVSANCGADVIVGLCQQNVRAVAAKSEGGGNKNLQRLFTPPQRLFIILRNVY